jgi:2-isopropylmalate synthase
MLVNLKLMGIPPWAEQDLTKLKEYCQAVSKATGVPIPANYPVVGDDAFRTATGVHAAAVIKAYKKKDIELANAVYSGVPSHIFGLEQIIDIGPMSGKSNVLFWLERHGVPATDEVVEKIYKRAKASNHTLTETEIRAGALRTIQVKIFNRKGRQELRKGRKEIPDSGTRDAFSAI